MFDVKMQTLNSQIAAPCQRRTHATSAKDSAKKNRKHTESFINKTYGGLMFARNCNALCRTQRLKKRKDIKKNNGKKLKKQW